MSKDEMIRKLVQHSVKTAVSEAKHYWLADLFENGFAGYRKLSRSQLERELQMRGLAKAEAAIDEDDLDDLDDLDVEDYCSPSLDLPVRANTLD